MLHSSNLLTPEHTYRCHILCGDGVISQYLNNNKNNNNKRLNLFITSTCKIKLGFNCSAGDSFPDEGIPTC